MIKILAALSLSLLSSSIAADENWIETAHNDQIRYSIKAGSLEITKNKRDEDIALVIGRTIEAKTSQINLYKWYVTLEDCHKGQGKFVTLKLNGEFYFDNDYVESSGSIGSSTAEFICGAYALRVKEKAERGI